MWQTFRATLPAWFKRVILPLASGCLWMCLVAWSGGTYGEGLFLAVPALFLALWWTIRLLGDWMELDGNAVTAHLFGHSYEVPWRQVIAAARGKAATSPCSLRLVTTERIYTFPLDSLRQEAIWRAVLAYAPPSALKPAAAGGAMAHPAAVVPCVELNCSLNGSLRVRVATRSSANGGISLVLAGATAGIVVALAWGGGAGVVLPTALAVVGALALVVSSGTLRMDAEWISYRSGRKERAIRWDTLTHIETDVEGWRLVFCGASGRLEVWAVPLWWGRERSRCASFLETQAQRLGIPTWVRCPDVETGAGSRREEMTDEDLRRTEKQRRGQDDDHPGFRSW